MKSKIIFLYDELMVKEKQKLLRLPIKFLSYGYIRAKMYWCSDDKKRRYFVIPPVHEKHRRQFNTFVYGGIFVINDYSEYERAIYSYYNCSISYTDSILQADLFIPQVTEVTPIVFKTLEEFENCRYTSLQPIQALAFFANQENSIIQNSLSHGRYYRRTSGIDVPNFLKLIKETNNG